MTASILNSVKKSLGLPDDYDAFDSDVMMHINSIFGFLHQLGVGPEDGFEIDGPDEEWSSFTEDTILLNPVKSYIYLRVRLLFDPPATSFHLTAIEKQIQEFEWRINVHREGTAWQSPLTM